MFKRYVGYTQYTTKSGKIKHHVTAGHVWWYLTRGPGVPIWIIASILGAVFWGKLGFLTVALILGLIYVVLYNMCDVLIEEDYPCE